ncbi:hypothetical protein PS838_00333 [Pseudomonas fluorescens]|nr:hypothetical protein PS838_00333 [Pseudomonas fluorescens]
MRNTTKPCRSELAREKLKNTAFIQNARVIVDAHREQSSVDRLLLQVISKAYKTSSSSTSNTSTLCGGMLPTP